MAEQSYVEQPHRSTSLTITIACILILLASLTIACASTGGPSRSAEQVSSSDNATPLARPCAATRAPLARPTPRAIDKLRESGALDPASYMGFCDELVEDPESCTVNVQLEGRAALVRVVTDCSGDSCSVRNWLFGDGPKPIELPSGGGGLVVTPDLRYVIADYVTRDPVKWGKWVVFLVRIELKSGSVLPFADCMSPVLSPKQKWIVCRTRGADVVRVPVDGGFLQLVARSNVAAETVDWVPYGYYYPGPVRFERPGRLSFEINGAEGTTMTTRSIRWSE